MNDLIVKLKNKQNLDASEIAQVMRAIMSGEADEEFMAAFLLALKEKGATVDEITGAVRLLQDFALPVHSQHAVILDTCGTGGDKQNTFNISTVTALVVAGAGVVVAKHGNRSVSSRCGSADILEALGVKLDVDPQHLSRCLDEVGIAFLFAQKLHPAMKNVAAVRRALGVETIFNILGPLINPARATHQVVGVYSRDLTDPIARVLANLGLKKALVVHGSDGLDEITVTGETFISEWDGARVVNYAVNPQELGIPLARPEDLKGGDLRQNIAIVEKILRGAQGPRRDIVVLNAAYALYVVGKVADVSAGIALAGESVDSGKALAKLEELKAFTNRTRAS